MFHLALRNVLRQRVRTALTLAAIVLGVASLILGGGYAEDLLVQLREATIRTQLGHFQIYKAGHYASAGQRPFEYLIDDATAVEGMLSRIPGVVTIASRFNFSGLIGNGVGEMPMLGEGVQPEAESQIGAGLNMLSGRRLARADRYGIVVGEGLAHALKIKVGDSVNLVTSSRDGAMNSLPFDVVGVFRSWSKEYDARAVQINLNSAEELVATKGVDAIVVLLDDTTHMDRVLASLRPQLPVDRYEIKTWFDLADFYVAAAALYKRQFGVLQIIILVMVLLSVANTVNMTLHERIGEFGVMRALGRHDQHIFRLAMLESAMLGFVGAVLGVVVGIGLALLISMLGIPMPPPPNSESGFTATIRLVPPVIATSFALGLVGAFVAALLPARKVSRVPVVDALRRIN